MDLELRQKINESWGILYSANDARQKFYLRKKRKTFRRTTTGVLPFFQSSSMANYVRNLTAKELFTMTRSSGDITDDIKIIIKPRPPIELYVDGQPLSKPKEVQDGKCSISIPLFKLNFTFEAFCDVRNDRNLKFIGENYRYIRVIGQGGYGIVYKGFRAETQEFCAIKMALKRNKKRTLSDEHELVGDLDHRAVVRVFDFITNQGREYLITELAPGGSLKMRLDSGETISEDTCRFIFRQCFSALKYIHNMEIIHRDIKPGNIVLMSDGEMPRVKIIDFGLAFFTFYSSELHRVAGTTKYMAPEMLTLYVNGGKKNYSFKIDVWSMAVTLFLALTQNLPFKYDRNTAKYHRRVLHDKMNTNTRAYEALSFEAKQILTRALDVNESRRPSARTLLKEEAWFL